MFIIYALRHWDNMTCFSPSHYEVRKTLIVPTENNKMVGPGFIYTPIFISSILA